MVCSTPKMKACTANSLRRILMPTEAVSYQKDLKQADIKQADLQTLRPKLSMAHQGHLVAATQSPVQHTTMALRVLRMEVDMCQTNSRAEAILKEVLDHPKRIVDMLLQTTVMHLFQDRLKPIRLKETSQQVPTQSGQTRRSMSVLSRIPRHRPSR
jgi:hypothetical protein